jgi:hypothetical protein
MSQHDFNIANQTASATRVDLNNALGALASLSSGTTAPTTTFANMLWYETDTNWLWVRNEADSAWIRFAYFDQATGIASVLDDTKVVNTSGTQTGLLGDQSTATWQAGTGTTQSLVSPANIKAAVAAADDLSIGGENTEGYIKMASGLIFQWGTTPPQSGGASITLPTTYPTAHTGAVASVARTSSIDNGNISAYAEPTGVTSLTVVHDGYGPGSDGVSTAVTWLSWGY